MKAIQLNDDRSFLTSVTAFFMTYLNIPEHLFKSGGVLTKEGYQTCANKLIDGEVFEDKCDMRLQAIKDFNIILPDWIFEYVKEG